MVGGRKRSFIEEKIGKKEGENQTFWMKRLGAAIAFGFVMGLAFCVTVLCFSDWLGLRETMEFRFHSPSEEEAPSQTVMEEGDARALGLTQEGLALSELDLLDEAKGDEWMEWVEDNRASLVKVLLVDEDSSLFQEPMEYREIRSGIAVTEKEGALYVLCNGQGLNGGQKLRVVFADGHTVDADVCAKDAETGLWMLEMEAGDGQEESKKRYRLADMGFMVPVRVGMPVVAMGTRSEGEFSTDFGIVMSEATDVNVADSKLSQYPTNLCYFEKGEGFVFNFQGKVLGVVLNQFANPSEKGIHTFIGVHELKLRIEQMVNKKERVYVGVKGNDVKGEYAQKRGFDHGIYVSEVLADSPAYHAGLTKGDVIVKVKEVNITSMVHFYSTISECGKDNEVPVEVWRKVKEEWRQLKVLLKMDKLDK